MVTTSTVVTRYWSWEKRGLGLRYRYVSFMDCFFKTRKVVVIAIAPIRPPQAEYRYRYFFVKIDGNYREAASLPLKSWPSGRPHYSPDTHTEIVQREAKYGNVFSAYRYCLKPPDDAVRLLAGLRTVCTPCREETRVVDRGLLAVLAPPPPPPDAVCRLSNLRDGEGDSLASVAVTCGEAKLSFDAVRVLATTRLE